MCVRDLGRAGRTDDGISVDVGLGEVDDAPDVFLRMVGCVTPPIWRGSSLMLDRQPACLWPVRRVQA